MRNHKTITDYISEQTNPYNSSGLPLPPPPHQTHAVTLRDQFAMAALTGMLAGRVPGERTEWVKSAYEFADKMMEERK
jgi:hypothetical protein